MLSKNIRLASVVVFATGDGGWRSVSLDVFDHLAALGYRCAGVNSPDAVTLVKRAGGKLSTAQTAERVGDSFAAEARQLGPDTPTLRLYEVESSNHRFGGARDKVIEDVDDALQWIEEPRRVATR